MKIRNSLLLSLSSACLVVAGAQLGQAQGPNPSAEPAVADSHATGGFVAAEVVLNKTLDARGDQPGAAFETMLKSSVHLKDGTELPKGTLLEGKVAAANGTGKGAAQFALVFTDAKLKGGKDVPIEATIVGLADPVVGTDSNSAYDGPAQWDGSSTRFDVNGAVGNVDLHSTLGSENSGTLVASGKGNVKLSSGSRISLALGDKSAN